MKRNNTALHFPPPALPSTVPCARSPVSCTCPVISSGDHPEFANDKASPRTRSTRWRHTTEDELVMPWTSVLVGVPLMALKMWREFGKTLVFSSRGQISRHRNTRLPKRKLLQMTLLTFIIQWPLLLWVVVPSESLALAVCRGSVLAHLINDVFQIRILRRRSRTTCFVSFPG